MYFTHCSVLFHGILCPFPAGAVWHYAVNGNHCLTKEVNQELSTPGLTHNFSWYLYYIMPRTQSKQCTEKHLCFCSMSVLAGSEWVKFKYFGSVWVDLPVNWSVTCHAQRSGSHYNSIIWLKAQSYERWQPSLPITMLVNNNHNKNNLHVKSHVQVVLL